VDVQARRAQADLSSAGAARWFAASCGRLDVARGNGTSQKATAPAKRLEGGSDGKVAAPSGSQPFGETLGARIRAKGIVPRAGREDGLSAKAASTTCTATAGSGQQRDPEHRQGRCVKADSFREFRSEVSDTLAKARPGRPSTEIVGQVIRGVRPPRRRPMQPTVRAATHAASVFALSTGPAPSPTRRTAP
jgi:hypothetical protein